MRALHRLIMLPVVLACLAVPGCGGGWEADTHPASGRVSVNGQPAAGSLVQLHSVGGQPDERNSRPWGLVKDDGTFALSTYQTGDGAPVGEYAVTLTWPEDPSVPSMTDRLGFRYSQPAQSRWKVSIREGGNALEPIEIADAQLDAKRSKGLSKSLAGPEMLGITKPVESRR